nr:fas apoptotic inhibitory molecule 3 [Pelodiscus sinensis]|eukprot:XP_025034353.1 fas apoptotic inhibitory molecule 3 [Pelodiscus sinensis]
MDFISMLLFLLQVSNAARRRVQMTGEVGKSITIICPVEDMSERKFWCREITKACVTMISTSPYIDETYKDRISISERPQERLFQVTIRRLEEEDAGLYACGTGYHNDRDSGKTLQVELNVFNGGAPHMLLADPPRRDRPVVVPAESGIKGVDDKGVTEPVMTARAKYASYTAPGTQFPDTRKIMPAKEIGNTLVDATTGSMTKGFSRTTGYAHPRPRKLLPRSSYGKDIFQILIPILLIIMLLVASMTIVRKQLQGRKGITIYMFGCSGKAAPSETYGINLRLSALEQVQGNAPVENIYSVCPRRLQGADKNSSHVPQESYHCRINL